MNILVTGGSGFLGSHIVDELVKRNHKVSIFDSKQSKYCPNNVKMIVGDIIDRESVDKAVKNNDIVYHLSGISGIEDCKQNPRLAFEVNVSGTFNILESCVKNDIKRLVFASSAYVLSKYGYIYKTTKIACENLIQDFNKIYNLSYTILRYGSLYGRRADNRNSIHNLLYNAMKYKHINYYGSGDEIREYIHVLDAAKLSVDILGDKYNNRNLMITGYEKFKYIDILNTIKEILPCKIKIDINDRIDDCHYKITPYCYDSDIGFKLTATEYIDFGQGILDCLNEIENIIVKETNNE